MKKILTVLILIISNSLFAQNDYPKYTFDSTGSKLVTLTLEQAQVLDNKIELLPLYEKILNQIGNLDTLCINTIIKKEKIINFQDEKIKIQKELMDIKDKKISNTELQIENYKLTEETYKKEIENKNKEIDLHINNIKKTRGKILIGCGVGVLIGFITSILILH